MITPTLTAVSIIFINLFFYRAQKRTATALYVMAVLIYPFIMYAAACRSRERTPQTHCRCGDKAPAPSRRRLRPTGPLWSKTIIAYAESGAGPEYNVTKVALSGRTRNHPRRILSTSYSQFTAANRRRKKAEAPQQTCGAPGPIQNRLSASVLAVDIEFRNVDTVRGFRNSDPLDITRIAGS